MRAFIRTTLATTLIACLFSACLQPRSVFRDGDGDGYPPEDIDDNNRDCDDSNPNVHPNAIELPNDIDDDCDGVIDEVGEDTDIDQDSYVHPEDCDDTSAAVYPGAIELCNGIDDNCRDGVDEDDPGGGGTCIVPPPLGQGECIEGTFHCVSGQIVCESNHIPQQDGPDVNCDGLDNDCDGTWDEGCQCEDGATQNCDNAGSGICAPGTMQCSGGSWGDCVSIFTPETETCDGLNNDCDSETDEDFIGMGLPCNTGQPGVCKDGELICNGSNGTACNQTTFASTEVCDGLDNDCDGTPDQGDTCCIPIQTTVNIKPLLATFGDNDFDSHGPIVDLDISFQSPDNNSILVHTCVTMTETKSDHTTGVRCVGHTIQTPNNGVIDDTFAATYTDTDDDADTVGEMTITDPHPAVITGSINCFGDTAGGDTCPNWAGYPNLASCQQYACGECSGCSVSFSCVNIIPPTAP